MNFNDIVGQDRAIQILKNVIIFDKVSQSYIFSGNDGIGKKLLAKIFAKALNCPNFSKDFENCECMSCRKIDKDIHPDITIFNTDKATIQLDDIKSMQDIFKYKNHEAKYRVLIVDGANKFTLEASNAFLKTLEEPPLGTIIILISNNLEKILKTIKSRCQIIEFKNLSPDEKFLVIEKNYDYSKELIEKALFVSNESINDAIKFLAEKNNEEVLKKFDFFLEAFQSKKLDLALEQELESISSAKQKDLFSKMLDYLINIHSKNSLKNQKALILLKRAKKYFNQNVNPKLIWSWLFLGNMLEK